MGIEIDHSRISSPFFCRVHRTLSPPSTTAHQVIRGGSTERTELDKLFFKYGDKGVLDFQAFKSAINALGMKISQLEAEQVYQHFAEEDCGGIKNQSFINDVLSDIT